MLFQAERNNIISIFEDNWAGQTTWVVENENFKPADLEPYVRIKIVNSGSDLLEVGKPDGYTRFYGMIIFMIYIPADGRGDGQARQLADEVTTIFSPQNFTMYSLNSDMTLDRNNVVGVIRVRSSYLGEFDYSENEAYYRLDVIVPFHRDS